MSSETASITPVSDSQASAPADIMMEHSGPIIMHVPIASVAPVSSPPAPADSPAAHGHGSTTEILTMVPSALVVSTTSDDSTGFTLSHAFAVLGSIAWRGLTRRKTPLQVAGAIFTLLAFLLVTSCPIMLRPTWQWSAYSSWAILGLIILAASWLKFSERYRHTRRMGTDRRADVVKRKATLAGLCDELLPVPTALQGERLHAVRKKILLCVSMSIKEYLDFDEHPRIVSNLWSIDGSTHMRRVASCGEDRKPGKTYPFETSIAFEAIARAQSLTVGDIRKHHYWRGQKRRYRSVLAIPVVRARRAFASVTIDCESPYAFSGRAPDLALEVLPYLTLLAMTYSDKDPAYDCNFDHEHLS